MQRTMGEQRISVAAYLKHYILANHEQSRANRTVAALLQRAIARWHDASI